MVRLDKEWEKHKASKKKIKKKKITEEEVMKK